MSAQINRKSSMVVQKLPLSGSPSAIYFENTNTGWYGSDKGVYRTTDAGRNWNCIYAIESGFSVNFIQFSNPSTGWILLQKITQNLSGFEHENDEAVILNTIDGGKSWLPQYRQKSVVVTSFKIVGENGWMTAVKYGPENHTNGILVRRLNDRHEWIDVSQQLNEGERSSQDGALGLFYATATEARIITADRKIYQTIDGGADWLLNGRFTLENFVVTYAGMTDSQISWLIEAVTGFEGTESRILILPRLDDGNEITSIDFPGYFLKGAIFDSDDILFAFGRDVVSDREGESIRNVILTSDDRGDNWRTLYSKEIQGDFVAAASNGESIFFVNSAGFILKLPLP
ncbi:MAG: hypothetical protein ABJA02_04295 [Acidobacteriota bacterium]